jgi:16S rRNA (cytidine1402-2'-O)-methyltransferase
MIIRELNYEGKTPLLYLVCTPIGNLGEMTPRAIETLKTMDAIACEDTRNSGLLLARFGLDKPLISCHEHNEEAASDKIVALLKEGKKIAYMSDAGYPSVSDPGERLASRCLQEGFKVAVLNGPSASLCALVGSGLKTDHFYFYGFLDSKPSARKKELAGLKDFKDTLIFYEAPHRIGDTLKDLSEAFGSERKACLCRELTKIHEEYIRGTLGELAALDPATLIGEIVIVVEGRSLEEAALTDEAIASLLKEKIKNLSSKEAIAEVSQENAIPKNRVYDVYLRKIKK